MKKLLLAIGLCLAAVRVFATPFSDLSFDAASKKAAETGKIVFVDFYTTWCGPCRLLDKTTWTNAEVMKLLKDKTVAIRLDAEKENKLASHYKIEAYPSMLLIKADGTEMDRLVGYRNAENFMTDFNAALKGRDAATKAKTESSAAKTNNPVSRMSHAQRLAQQGKNAEALKEYLWCFDHGDEVSPSFDAIRVTVLVGYINNLGARYPAARKALDTRRDERQSKFFAGAVEQQSAVELVHLNNALAQKDKNLAVFDRLTAGSAGRHIICGMIIEQLLEAKRYADILSENGDTKTAFAATVKQCNEMADMLDPKNPVRDSFVEGYHKYAVDSGAHLFEALAGLKKNDAGRELAGEILKFDSSPTTRETLSEAAKRASNTELAQYVQK
ncbi:MAG: polymerase, sigma-24 subunit, subfamily [Verrucomicrobiales bacterium]|nr:polymerase, sigma-24 subunit, subfamily [Verrucomicrobiales bacterium]